MARDHIVSIRLSNDERGRLRRIAARGQQTMSDVVRGFVQRNLADTLTTGISVATAIPDTVWFDGTTGRSWPEAATR